MVLEVLVNPQRIVFSVVRRRNLVEVVVSAGVGVAGQVGRRVAPDDVPGDSVETGGGDTGAGEEGTDTSRSGGQRIGNLERSAGNIEGLGEITGALQRGWHRETVGDRRPLAKPFKVEKPKCLVLDQRAARGKAKLIEAEDGPLRSGAIGEKTVSVQLVIAEKIVEISVERICSALGDNVHVHAATVAVFGVQSIGGDRELFNVVDAGDVGHAVGDVVGDPVHKELVGTVVGTGSGGVGDAIDIDEAGGGGGGVVRDAGGKVDQHQHVTRKQRHVLDGALVDVSADGGGGCFQQRRFTGDLYRVGNLAQLQRKVRRGANTGADGNLLHTPLEARLLNGCLVAPRINEREKVIAVLVGHCVAGNARFHISQRNLHAGQRSAGSIDDGTIDGTNRLHLRVQKESGQKHKQIVAKHGNHKPPCSIEFQPTYGRR